MCKPMSKNNVFLISRYKGKSYRAVVEICKKVSQLEEFCRQICIKLECCPYLFSPLLVENNCPENCMQLTKTKIRKLTFLHNCIFFFLATIFVELYKAFDLIQN